MQKLNNFSSYSPAVRGLTHGADYFPEQWLDRPDLLEEDIRLMREAACNIVSVGMFAWSFLEPREGHYETGWLREVLDRLHRGGIRVLLATPSAAPPRWLTERYEETRLVTEDGRRRRTGERTCTCLNSPVFREKATAVARELARQFSTHPAVVGWHISNEYGSYCHCPICEHQFQEDLRERYGGNIEALNKSWWTAFWSHRYDDFSEIQAPSRLGEHHLHALRIHWKHFQSRTMLRFFEAERDAVLEASERRLPVTTNFHIFTDISHAPDYGDFARAEDFVSWDDYPEWSNPRHDNAFEASRRAMIHDLCRSYKNGKPFVLMECSPSAVNWQAVCTLREPGLQVLSSVQALAHGADSVQYFQWRKSLGASEKFHGAVVGHGFTNDSRSFREVKQTGELIRLLSEKGLAGCGARHEIALVYDYGSAYAFSEAEALRVDKPSYFSILHEAYVALREMDYQVDFIDARAESERLAQYKLILAPLLYAVREEFARRICEYVKSGGHFWTGCFSSIVNEDDHVYEEGRPGPLRRLLGLRVEESDAFYGDDGVFVEAASPETSCGPAAAGADVSAAADNLRSAERWFAPYFIDLLHCEGAEPLYLFSERFYKGMPAFCRHSFGRGRAYYAAFLPRRDFYRTVFADLLPSLGIARSCETLPSGMHHAQRRDEHFRFEFFMNFSREEKQLRLPFAGEDLCAARNRNAGEVLTFAPYGYTVLRRPAEDASETG